MGFWGSSDCSIGFGGKCLYIGYSDPAGKLPEKSSIVPQTVVFGREV